MFGIKPSAFRRKRDCDSERKSLKELNKIGDCFIDATGLRRRCHGEAATIKPIDDDSLALCNRMFNPLLVKARFLL